MGSKPIRGTIFIQRSTVSNVRHITPVFTPVAFSVSDAEPATCMACTPVPVAPFILVGVSP